MKTMLLLRNSIRPTTRIMMLTLMLALAACATTNAPTGKMAVAEAAIARADTQSTSNNAAAELKIATDKLDSARRAMARKDYELAARLAEQATIDAQVAELHAQSAVSRKAAQESQDAARALSEEITRKSRL